MLCWRSWADVRRNPVLAIMHLVFASGIGLMVGFVYFNQHLDTSGAWANSHLFVLLVV